MASKAFSTLTVVGVCAQQFFNENKSIFLSGRCLHVLDSLPTHWMGIEGWGVLWKQVEHVILGLYAGEGFVLIVLA